MPRSLVQDGHCNPLVQMNQLMCPRPSLSQPTPPPRRSRFHWLNRLFLSLCPPPSAHPQGSRLNFPPRYLCLLKSVLHFLSSSRLIPCFIHLATKLLERFSKKSTIHVVWTCYAYFRWHWPVLELPSFIGIRVVLADLAFRCVG